jgi:broad specificity polyphosphatase/5'/3'-nucleotidase SurE
MADNMERDERGDIVDVIVDEQMTDAGRAAYWQAISEGATPREAYSDAEAVEFQERRAIQDLEAQLVADDVDEDTKVAIAHV